MRLFKSRKVESDVVEVFIQAEQQANGIVHINKNLSHAAELKSQWYEKCFVIITVYNPQKIAFTVCNDSHQLETLVYKTQNAPNDNKIQMRVALYDATRDPIIQYLSKGLNKSYISSLYEPVINLLMASKHRAHDYPLLKKRNFAVFCDLLHAYKQEELQESNDELKSVMAQYDEAHGCFGYEESSSNCCFQWR